MLQYKRINNILGWVVFIIATSVYFFTLEPTASFWDSGEFISTAYKLQIPHPPGAPLYLLVGRIFSMFAIDSLHVAYAVNALSAVSSGLAVLFLFWTIVLLSLKLQKVEEGINWKTSWVAAAIGALSFAFTDSFWYSATEAEVYGLSTFFIAIIFWAIFKWDRLTDPVEEKKWILLIMFITGLSVGVHLLNLLAIPSLGLVYYFKKYKQISKKGVFLALLGSGGVLLFVMYGLVWLATAAKYMELLFVNQLGLPFNTGAIVLLVLVVGGLIYGIYYSHQQNKYQLNTLLLGIVFVMIGYSSYTTILIRANYSTPVNQNDPKDILGLIYYLRMEQYPTRPLLYGKNFTSQVVGYEKGSPTYELGEDQYEIKDYKFSEKYADGEEVLLPRMWSSLQPGHAQEYRRIMGLRNGEVPTFSENVMFMMKHQIGHMYWRYFMWNFAGRAGSEEGAGWLLPWETDENLPSVLKDDKARNNYFMLPMIMGFVGLFFLYRKNKQVFYEVMLLFLMTGVVLVIYLNSPPTEPRERDYIYVGSYYAFALAIGLGVLGFIQYLRTRIQNTKVLLCAASITAVVPLLLFIQNFDDHNRSQRYYSVESARNTLASCEPNAILFTGGDNDTYPLWYVQEVEGFRQDVRVIVLSYANVDWYINPMFDKVNKSEALPLSLTKENYKQGSPNDYLLVSEAPNLGEGILVNKYLELIKRKHKGITSETATGEVTIVPSRKLILNKDSSKVLDDHDLPEKLRPFVSDKMVIDLKGNALQKRDLLILDLLDSNKWERPIYFNFTSMNQLALDITDHVVQVGDVFRLLPIKKPDQYPNEHLVNSERMYENLIDKYQFTNLDRSDIHYSGYYNFFTQNSRNQFNLLARTLIMEGDPDTARKVLQKSVENFPDDGIPFDVQNVETVQLLLAVGDKDTADQVSEKLSKHANEWLAYADLKQLPTSNMRTRRSLFTLNELARTYSSNGFANEASVYAGLFNQHYKGS